MESQAKVIKQFQEAINLEFNKKFDFKVNDRTYMIAFRLDEIPTVKGVNKYDHIITIFFKTPDKPFHKLDNNKLINLLEKEPGNFEAVVINLNEREIGNKFKIGREVVEEINDNEMEGDKLVTTKRRYLLHAICDALLETKESFWNINFSGSDQNDCQYCLSSK